MIPILPINPFVQTRTPLRKPRSPNSAGAITMRIRRVITFLAC